MAATVQPRFTEGVTSLEPRTPRFLVGVPAGRGAAPMHFPLGDELELPVEARRPAQPPPADRPPAGQAARRAQAPEAAPPPPAPPPAPNLEQFEQLKQAIGTLQAQGKRFAEQARADSLEIAFLLARKIVEAELRTDPEPLHALVRSALRQVGESRKVRLRVAPEDVELLRSPQGAEAIGGLTVAQVELVGDPSLAHGDCVVDTDFGFVDGRLSARFQELRRALDAAEVQP